MDNQYKDQENNQFKGILSENKNKETLEISSTGYGYESVTDNDNVQVKKEK